jgi:hypothetical protein
MSSSVEARTAARRGRSRRPWRAHGFAAAFALLGTVRLAGGQSATPLPSVDVRAGSWQLMYMGFADAQFDAQGGSRGATQTGSINWGMLMATHAFAGGQLQLRTMLSLDAIGVGGSGYPELLQSGETYNGMPLHDRQHPHDAFMELAAKYQYEFSRGTGVSLYAAPVGEPALGPVAFMMRPSALDNPIAPIGHHWQDATHVSFGVLSLGFFTSRWRLEGSWFNGREPDANRWNIDPIRLDSWSGRLTFDPSSHWSMAASYGYLNSPVASAPLVSERRATFSLSHGVQYGVDGQWSSALIWGGNNPGGASMSSSVLAESELSLDDRNSLFARAEYVQKSADDLVLDVAPFAFAPERIFDVYAISLGYVRELALWNHGTLGIGVLGTLNAVPAVLRGAYGSTVPVGAMIFVRVRPRRAKPGDMPGMVMDSWAAVSEVRRP